MFFLWTERSLCPESSSSSSTPGWTTERKVSYSTPRRSVFGKVKSLQTHPLPETKKVQGGGTSSSSRWKKGRRRKKVGKRERERNFLPVFPNTLLRSSYSFEVVHLIMIRKNRTKIPLNFVRFLLLDILIYILYLVSNDWSPLPLNMYSRKHQTRRCFSLEYFVSFPWVWSKLFTFARIFVSESSINLNNAIMSHCIV